MAVEIETVGRESELATLRDFIERPTASSAVVIEGTAGIGKTTLFREGVAVAEARGLPVLSAAPTQSETLLGFSALHDLFDGVFEDVASDLPSPQRKALAVALLREDPDDRAPEQGAISAATLRVLRTVAAEGGVMVAIDDAQWLDPPSAAVLAYVFRRISSPPILILVTLRTDTEGDLPLGLDRLDARSPVTRIRMGPLSLGAIHHLIATRLQVSMSRWLLRRVHHASEGNPFFALEIARSLQRGDVSELDPLPIGPHLHELVSDRLTALGSGTREVLSIAAAASSPTVDVLHAVLGRDPRPDLGPAVDAQVIEMHGERIRFTHPLLISGLDAEIGSTEREAVHARLAAAVRDPEERARHLALGSRHPDAGVASALEDAARRAFRRGAPATAADLFGHAIRLSPAGDPGAGRRAMGAADAHFEAGEAERSLAILEQLVRDLPPGGERAQALWRLGTVKGEVGSAASAVPPYEQALAESGDDRALQASIRSNLAVMMCFVGDQDRAARDARAAVEAAEASLRPDLISEAIAAASFVDLIGGREPSDPAMTRALALERSGDRIRIDRCATLVHGFQLLWSMHLPEARVVFERLRAMTSELGDESNAPVALWNLALVELLAGNWGHADGYIAEARQIADITGVNRFETLTFGALVDAHLGRVEQARATGETMLAAAEDFDEPIALLRSLNVLGFLELSLDRAPEAHGHFERAARAAERAGLGQPWFLRFLLDDVEALVSMGEPDRAEHLLERSRESARESAAEWQEALARRARGLILAARGDLSSARDELERARLAFEELGLPFELGRTLLGLGTVQRRSKERGVARKTLEGAATTFDALGAPLWYAKAQTELDRIGGRVPRRHDLTSTERRVAELVAQGRSNKEVAAALFVSAKTVEASLTRIYGKMGVRSRTELARRMLDPNP
jgi:DNA-binding CsgD family transcriptional regulator